MLKRFMLIILSAILIIGTFPAQSYATVGISNEGRICRELGMLKGDTGVVDERYLETKPTRFQAAIMYLRLKGLEDEALSYTGNNNFDDARLIAWESGRNLLSYLKNHPELGWIGDGYNFRPNNLITAKEYYKVLLEALGYKQMLDGAGDFSWDNVLAFADGKGLSKVANVSLFTVDSLAVATVEALKSKMKGSSTKLIDYLIDKGLIDKQTAQTLELYRDQFDAEVESVTAISNSRVEVVFREPVYSISMDYKDDFTVSRGSFEVDIKNIYQKNAYSVVLEVSPLAANNDYTVAVKGGKYPITALAKDTKVPAVIDIEGKDTNLVEITFDKLMDAESVQNAVNYAIKDVTIKSAMLDKTNTKVLLGTQGMEASRSYELKIKNVKSADGVTVKSITKRFVAKRDITAPSLQTITVVNNERLELKFKDANGLDKESAEDAGNYSIKSSKGDLDVYSAKASDKDNDGLLETVTLITSTQTVGAQYTLHISNISDDSVLRNKISREIKKDFRGKNKDNSAPKIVGNPYVITDNKLQIVFNDTNALDMSTVENLQNYELSDDLEVIRAEIKDPLDPYSDAGRTVILTTSEMEKSKQYTIIISGISDEFGNELDSSSKKYYFRGRQADHTPPYIVALSTSEDDEIILNFDDCLDKASAEDTRNYKLDGLSLVTKADMDANEKTVTLTTTMLTSSSSHKLLLNGIKDLAGNPMRNVTVNVSVSSSYYNSDPAEVSYIEAIYEDEIRVHFEERVKARNALLVASGITFEQRGEVIDEGTTIIMRASQNMENKEYYVSGFRNVTNYNNKPYSLEDGLSFYGTTEENDHPSVDTWDQINVKTFRVIFSEPVLLAGNGVSGIHNPSGVSLTWTAEVNPDDEENNDSFTTIDYTASGKIPVDKDFNFNFSQMVTDYVGTYAEDEADTDSNSSGATLIESYLEDEDGPYVEAVDAVTTRRVEVTFNEEIEYPGRYKITYTNDKDKLTTIPVQSTQTYSDDEKIVRLLLDQDLSSEYIYTLEVVTAAKDIAGNGMEIEDYGYDFEGVDVKDVDYLQGVDVNSATSFIITKSDTISQITSVAELDANGNVIDDGLMRGIPERIRNNECEVTVKRPLFKNVSYRVTVDGLKYTFKGIVENSDITIDEGTREIKFSYVDTYTQEVMVARMDGTKLDTYESNNRFYIRNYEHITRGEILYVWVEDIDENKIIYGARVVMEGGTVGQSSQKNITEFAFLSLNPDVYGVVNESNKIITVTVPKGTDIHSLTPTVKVSAYASIYPSSGSTRDFSVPKTYTVTAQDGSAKIYTVKVSFAEELSSQKDILSFAFKALDPDVYGDINEDTGTIRLIVPYGTDITHLLPTISISPKASIRPSEGTALDFSVPRSYTVTAENGTTKSYIVKVEVADSRQAKRIISFDFNSLNPDVKGVIDEDKKRVTLTVPYRTDLTELAPTITTSPGTTVSPASHATVDFSGNNQPVIYTVKGVDNSTQTYKVYVNIQEPGYQKLITGFNLAGIDGYIDQVRKTIVVKVPYGTALEHMQAIIELSDHASVYPSSGSRLDFTGKERVFTVTSQDGTTAEYTVYVVEGKSSRKIIEYFAFEGLSPRVEGNINQENKTITLSVPTGTPIDNITPTIRVSDKAVVEPGSWEPRNFTASQAYTVTAEDGSKAVYTVNVNYQNNYEKQLKEFMIKTPFATGVIDEAQKTVVVSLPKGTDVTNLVAIVKCSDNVRVTVKDVVQDSGNSVNDFSAPVVYRVTARDGSFVDYTVYAKVVERGEKRITSFTCTSLNPQVKGVINERWSTITLEVPRNTDLKQLVMSFSYIGSSITIGDVEQVSGVTKNNFTYRLKYTITAANGSHRTYTVIVTKSFSVN